MKWSEHQHTTPMSTQCQLLHSCKYFFSKPLSHHRMRADVTSHAMRSSSRTALVSSPGVICTSMHVSCLQTYLTNDAFLIIWHLRLTWFWLCACGASVHHSIYSTQLTVFPSLLIPVARHVPAKQDDVRLSRYLYLIWFHFKAKTDSPLSDWQKPYWY